MLRAKPAFPPSMAVSAKRHPSIYLFIVALVAASFGASSVVQGKAIQAHEMNLKCYMRTMTTYRLHLMQFR